MAVNDKFQLTNYGVEVQKAIDDALYHIPPELALKAYRDEVLVKNQTTPYTPTDNYHPATKLYVDTANSATNQRLDDEIARAKKAEDVLNKKQVLTFDDANFSYKYLNLVDINRTTQALVDENALDQKLSELSLGFFKFYQVVEATGELVEEKYGQGVNPYIVVKTQAELPKSGVPANAIGLTLKDANSINVYKYTNSAWTLLNSPDIDNGWLFASTSTVHGYYWFVNTWNLIDMNVDMTQYYKKTEVDNILKDYALNSTVGTLSSLTTTDKADIVTAINEVNKLAKAKDTLPTIAANSVLANKTASSAKPSSGLVYQHTVVAESLAQRTSAGTLKAANATANDDLTTLSQVKQLISDIDMSTYQSIIPAGTANNIVAYSGTAGKLNTLTRATTINATLASTSDTKIPTEKATATYVQNYKPIIITQGNSNTSVTTSQLTFWIEQ